jgi:hypothetical protein
VRPFLENKKGTPCLRAPTTFVLTEGFMQAKPIILTLSLFLTGTEAQASMPTPTQLNQIPALTSSQKHSLQTLYSSWIHQTKPLLCELTRLNRRIIRLDTALDQPLSNTSRPDPHRPEQPDPHFDSLWRQRYGLLAVQNKLTTSLSITCKDFWHQAKMFLNPAQIHALDSIQNPKPHPLQPK